MSDQQNPSAPVKGTGQPDTTARERLNALKNAPKPRGPLTIDTGKPSQGGGLTKVAGEAVGTAPGSGEASVSPAPAEPVAASAATPLAGIYCSVFTVPPGANPIGKRVFLNEDGTMGKQTLGDFNRLQCVTTNFADLKALAAFVENAGPEKHLTAGICAHEKAWIIPGGAKHQ